MAAQGGVIRSAGKDGTEAIWNVSAVNVLQSHNTSTAVERAGGKDAGVEGLL